MAYIFLTHIHLDHAGGASECMRRFPNAKLVVHPRGARHMADPTRLVAGATAVYGEAEFKRVYGEIHAIDADRIIEAPDDFRMDLNGRPLLFLDTPGHARHHYSIYDERSNAFFTGDTFGVSYRDFDVDGMEFIFPTTTPVQFDPIAAHASLDRIMSYNPQHVFLTHYSRIGHLTQHAESMHSLINSFVEISEQANKDNTDRHTRISTAIQELTIQATYSLFPNPTNGNANLFITTENLNADIQIEIYSASGKLISTKSKSLQSGIKSDIPLNLTNQAAGVYFIKIKDAQNHLSKTLRIIKQ